jgi:predicted protein tyrosine phosphatase
MKLDLTICRADEAVGLVNSSSQSTTPYDAVISIEHPGAELLTAEQGRAPRLAEEIDPSWREKQIILVCWDTEFEAGETATPPGKNIVTDALAFVQEQALVLGKQPRVLIHCRAGKSRSAALGLILLHHVNGLSPEAAVSELLRLRPVATPNLAIVRHAEGGSALADAVLAHPEIAPRRLLHVGQNPLLKSRPRGGEFGL